MSHSNHFIEPLDVLFLRGNKLFGEPGSFGEAQMPPWPSVAAGALRSALLVERGVDLQAFAAGDVPSEDLGTPERPGSFTLSAFQLARRHACGRVEPLYALPADLHASRVDGRVQLRRLRPKSMDAAIRSSYPLPMLPMLQSVDRNKPESGLWTDAEGWARYLRGELPESRHLIAASELWQLETRIGIGLSPGRGAADDGRLFSTQAVALRKREQGGAQGGFDVGFLARVDGCALPDDLGLRLGGDGRLARAIGTRVDWPQPDFDALARAERLRIVLASPSQFARGWLPDGVQPHADGSLRLDLHGVRGRLACAAVPRPEVVSGYDLARRRPKPAQRLAPAGSVYWLDQLEASPANLRKLAEAGLWDEAAHAANPRRAEGFNRIHLALD